MILNCLFLKPTFYPKNIIMHIKLQIIFSFFFLNCVVVQVSSQKKLDNYFLLGDYGNSDTIINPLGGGLSIEFTTGNPVSYRKDRLMGFNRDIAIMCNDTGKLLFYTNGIYINDARDSIMHNGDTINANNIEFHIPQLRYTGSWISAASIIIPMPNNQYFLFHTDFKLDKITNYYYYPAQIKVSSIDMNLNNGLGAVTKKGKLLWDVGLWEVQGRMTATQHANGRDWWIMTNTFPFNKYISFLATPDSVYGPFIQELGAPYESMTKGRGNGRVVFSPDGRKLAFSNITDGVVLLDFDRCTGILSNYRRLETSNIKIAYGDILFSPNSKYLYLTNTYNLYQYNTDTTNIAASIIHIDTIDGFKDPLFSSFNIMAPGPDGKIYMSSIDGVHYFNIINNPDERGNSCNFKQHSFNTSGIAFGFGMPNIPNYRLGPLKGSPCDTISVANKEITTDDFDIKLFPNPASTDIKIDITLKEYDPAIKTEVVIVDISGAIVQKYTMPDFAYIANIDISKLASGVYGVQLRQPKKFGERVLATQKLVVLR